MKDKLNSLPLWLINLLTIISIVLAIPSAILTIISLFVRKLTPVIASIVIIVSICATMILMVIRIRKYRNLAFDRMKEASSNYHMFLHEARDLFFDVLHSYKKGTLTESELSSTYKVNLRITLDRLCCIVKSFTGREVSSCIKLISNSDNDETIDIQNAKLVTFSRSTNSDTNRAAYESNKEILLSENTDFSAIIDKNYDKNYFYQGDLEKFATQQRKLGRFYKNSNMNWSNFYKGTIVVPIQIEFKRLYHQRHNESYKVIGFLCIDSLSKDAFTEKQEKYNVNVLKSFADALYILFHHYRYFLKELTVKKVQVAAKHAQNEE